MATKKAGGTAKNLRDSNPKYLGTKLYDGEPAKKGFVLVRQRGTVIFPGKNVGMGKDHTLFALKDGTVKFTEKRRTKFNSKVSKRKFVNIEET
jgi:large subunit ribosomal protein L27